MYNLIQFFLKFGVKKHLTYERVKSRNLPKRNWKPLCEKLQRMLQSGEKNLGANNFSHVTLTKIRRRTLRLRLATTRHLYGLSIRPINRIMPVLFSLIR